MDERNEKEKNLYNHNKGTKESEKRTRQKKKAQHSTYIQLSSCTTNVNDEKRARIYDRASDNNERRNM